ncbi:DUF3575 domain-containing protein [Phaeocystidibacter luteus]|uniref:DUF3575 domain-containing protein n=1 Tax=Phaeocystidibacter luteus TaxID=911197 RepID=A0A6N6RMT0_9FLAO|nr:DUF3575 domain-containing protein [Phaeocystidibacter luteus]KAB2814866.1 DUF3575 domain-containing protein [Phaeocystidibacter luteus]
MKLSKLLFAVMALSLGYFAQAQDLIEFRNGDLIEGTVHEIGVHEVTYSETGDDLRITVDKSEIVRIDMENGRMYKFESDPLEFRTVPYQEQYSRGIKVGMFTPVMGSFRVEYEQNLRPGRSIMASANIIGLGLNPYESNQAGLGLNFGYKFMTSPSYYLERQKRAHRMMGSYLMLEAATSFYGVDEMVGYYDNNGFYQYQDVRTSNFAGALIVSYGKQYVFGERILLDYSIGAGYGFRTSSVSDDEFKNNQDVIDYVDDFDAFPSTTYNFLHFGNEVPIVIKARLSIGFMF